MRRLIQILTGLLLFCILLFSISFSLLNRTPIPLNFGLSSLPAQPVSVWVISAFCLGGILGLLLGSRLLSQLRSRNALRRLRKELLSSQREIKDLKITLRRMTPLTENETGLQTQISQQTKEGK